MLVLTATSLVKGIEHNIATLLIVHDDKELMVFIIYNNVAHIIRSFALVIRVLYVAGKKLILAIERNNVNSILT